MQVRLDGINRILREQITGIRVIRAFVREPEERERFARRQRRARPRRRCGPAGSWPGPSRRQPDRQPRQRRGAVAGRVRIDSGRSAGRLAGRLPVVPHPDPDGGHAGDVHHLDGPAGVGVGGPDPGGHRDRLDRRSAARAGPDDAPAPSRSRVPEGLLPLPGSRASGPRRHLLRDGSRRDDRDRRQHRRRQDHAAAAHPAAVRRHRWRRSGSVASTSASSTPRTCGPASGWCRSGRTCSAGRSPPTCGTACRDATEDEMWEALEIAQAADFVRGCRAVSRRASSRAAPTSPVGSGSGWRSRGPWYAGRTSTCSTTRSPRSTWRPTPGCGRRCGRTPRTAPC